MTTDEVLALVASERFRQWQLWGDQDHSAAKWLVILSEEFGEVAKEVNLLTFEATLTGDERQRVAQRLKAELVQVAAVCCQIVERMG